MLEINTLPWDWQMGVNDTTLYEGKIWEPRWEKGSDLPRFYSGDIKEGFSYRESARPILNFFEYETFILPSGYNFEVRTDIAVDGSDSYNLPFKAADIVAVSRYIKTDIVSVVSDSGYSQFTIAKTQTDAISKYDARFLINNANLPANYKGRFLCRITNPATNEKVFRGLTVSSSIFTLVDYKTGEVSPVTGMSRNWTFELLGAYNMLPESYKIPATINEGYIVKNVALGTGEASIKFASRDKPVNKNEKLAVVYYSVQNARPQYCDPVSIAQHGIYTKSEKPDFILEQSQLLTLQNNSSKYYQPQRKFKLRTRRPSKLREGAVVPFNLSRFPKGNYTVSSVNVTILHEQGEVPGTTFDEVEYEFSNYDYDLDIVLLSLKRKNDVTKAKVAQSLSLSYIVHLNINVSYKRDIPGNNQQRPAMPFNFTNSNITSSGFTANWSNGELYDEIYFEYSENYFADILVSATLLGNATTYNVTGLNPDVLGLWRVYGKKNGVPSFLPTAKSITTLSAFKSFSNTIKNDTDLSIIFDQTSMTGSGLSITDSKSSVIANFYKNTSFNSSSNYPTWVSDIDFGNGIRLGETEASALEILNSSAINSRLSGTWMFLLKFREKDQNGFILNKVSQYSANISDYQLFVESSNNLKTILYDEANNDVSNDASINTTNNSFITSDDVDKVILITFTYDVNTHELKMYKNNTLYAVNYVALKAFSTFTGLSISYSALYLGAYITDSGTAWGSGYRLRADLFGFLFIKRALSGTEVANEANHINS